MLKQFKLPLILATIGAIPFSLNAFMNNAKVGGVNEQKVTQYEASIEQLNTAEQNRSEQTASDAINVAKKITRDSTIKKTFAEYRARLSNSKQTQKEAEHENPQSNNATANYCELSANDFGVLIAAYNNTFGKQLATRTRGQPAPASAHGSAASQRHTAGIAGVQPAANGIYSAHAQQLQQFGKRSARKATATG